MRRQYIVVRDATLDTNIDIMFQAIEKRPSK